VTDKSGNTNTGTFNVTVQDTTAPVITLPGSTVNAEATGSAGAVVNFNVTATDAADGSVSVICTPTSGGTFPIGTTPVACRANDQAGIPANATFSVVVSDKTAPVLNLPANMSVQSTNAAGATVTFNATATDVVDGAVTPVCSPASGATFPVGNTTVNCTASDKAGNPSNGSFIVSVSFVDNVLPTIIVPDTITIQATSDAGVVVNYNVTASDNVDGELQPSCTPASGSLFPLGPTRVECSVKDKAGNEATAKFMVVVTPAPKIEPSQTTTPTVTGSFTPSATFTPTVIAQQTPITPINLASADATNDDTPTETAGLPPAP
jgi:hypothetical protein